MEYIKKIKKRILIIFIMLTAAGLIYKGHEKEVSREIFAMDTYMRITCYGDRAEEAADAAVREIKDLDGRLSAENPDSEVAEINARGYSGISSDTSRIIKMAGRIYDVTEGSFDITVYPLMKLWGFTDKEYRLPEHNEIQDMLRYVNGAGVCLEENDMAVRLMKKQRVDFGGIAKGFASDRIMEIFREYALSAGIVSLGGNVQFYGKKPRRDLSDYFIDPGYRCAIKDPDNPYDGTKYIGIIKNADGAVITSGAYERYFDDKVSGKRYHHILNPMTGYPAESDLKSVTIVSSQGMLADALSTALYVMGRDKACDFWRQHGSELGFDMCLMDDMDRVYVTKELSEKFETEYEVTVIE